MTNSERYINVLTYRGTDRVPNMEIALWGETIERWKNEGISTAADIEKNDFWLGNEYLGLDGVQCVELEARAPLPGFTERVLEESETQVLFMDAYGRTRRASKVGVSMDQYLDFAVKNLADLLDMQNRYRADVDLRYPRHWEEAKETLRVVDKPIHLMNACSGTFGFYSMLRDWMGTEGLSYALYDDPVLIEQSVEFLTEYSTQLFAKAVDEIDFDIYIIHEDLCYKNGPLISPELFQKFLFPSYKRFISFLKSHRVKLVMVDSDGNYEKLIPLFLESGVDGFLPNEVAAGMDPVMLRQKYGKSFCLQGGVDKREIAKGKKAIEAQIRKLVPVIEVGGYIPTIDHSIPPDVSLDNFMYYLQLKKKALNGEL